ncbi:MAG: hypothetical protein ABIP76_02475 [Verrucomicrobiota bacterium]
MSPRQIEELAEMIKSMRHDINNHLSMVVFSVDILRTKPELTERMIATLSEQPAKISKDLAHFSEEFERIFGIIPKVQD